MDIMRHANYFLPAVARTPGDVDYPIAVHETFPPLPPATATVAVKVGVVDTGVVLDAAHRPHPWFGDHVRFGDDDVDELLKGGVSLDRPSGTHYSPGKLVDADGHGTFVTGLILREAPAAQVVMRGVLDKGNRNLADGLTEADDEMVAEAVYGLAKDDTVQVINLSFAGAMFSSEPRGLREVLLKYVPERIAVVAAAGNDPDAGNVWPAAFDGVIAVGALDQQRLIPPGATPPRAWFSNDRPYVKTYASGVQVLGPFVDFDETGDDDFGARPPQHFHGWARWSGTSFAAAIVSGRIAQTAIQHTATGREAAEILRREARKIFLPDIPDTVWVRGGV